ncbi:hypothetical protein [Pseudomonas phage Astolliot]|nr:hypothetical protein [Pseudomonas phage Astolliot]
MSRETVYTAKIRQFVAVVQVVFGNPDTYFVTRHCNGTVEFDNAEAAIQHADEWVKAQHLADLEKV